MVIEVPYRHIRDLRQDKNYTQATVAKAIGLAQNTYSQYETGRIEWRASDLVRLAKFYGVSVDYLLDLTENPVPYSAK